MNLDFLSLKNQKDLIDGVKLFKLKVNRDNRGLLVETLKTDWREIFNDQLPFGQIYVSVTNPGFARDEDVWHCHPSKQVDRFFVIKGNAVFALFDWRKESPTFGKLNLFLMGEFNNDDNQYVLAIPKNVLHGFCVMGDKPCYLLGQPTSVYDKNEEGRIPFKDIVVNFADGSNFSWDILRNQFFKK